MGRDFSGVVSQVGAGVTDFKVGDAVFGVLDQGIEGTYAEKIAIPAATRRQEARFAQPCRRRGARAHQPHRAHGDRRYRAPQSRSDHSDPGRRRRRRRICRATRQAPRRHGDHDRQRRQPCLCAQPRRRPGDRLQRGGFHQDRSDLRRGVRHRRRRRARRLLQGAQARRQTGVDRAGAGRLPAARRFETLRPEVKRDRAHLERLLALLQAGAVRPPPIHHYKLADAAAAHKVSEARHLQGKLVLDVR